MNRGNRATQSPRRGPDHAASELPDLRRWLRQIRDHQGLSRPEVARRSSVSAGLLKAIELGTASCTSPVLEQLMTAYELDSAQQRHTRALTQLSAALTPVEELRRRRTARTHLATLNRLDELGAVGAYIDPLWNIVYANRCFRTRLPGVDAYDDNLALWFFHPDTTTHTAEPLVVDWDAAAVYFVASLRAGFGVHRDTPQALALFQKLRGAVTFNRLWETSIALAYGYQTDERVHLRVPVTGEPYTARIHVGSKGNPDVRFCLGYLDHCPPPTDL
ncbi:helix-turn-helix domain-containing protein [Nocardia asteroides]|uniref:helix-turn-helix domain-containing protein n=1 Tax=Nocardia asteroides TaxID=1824 RepID=UPI00342151E8